MTKQDNKKVSYTLRLNGELSAKIEKEADSLGLNKSAYITMVLHKLMMQEKWS